MQDASLLISGSIGADNAISAQTASGLNAVTLSAHSIDLGSARDIGEGQALFLKVMAASGASAVASANYTAYNNGTSYVRGEKCSSGGIDYNCILASTGHSPPNATYWEVVPDSIEIQLISATNAALTTGLSVLATTGAITVYPPYNKVTAYTSGDKCTYKGKNYNCIASSTGHTPPDDTYWDEIGTGISDGLVVYLPVPVQIGSKGKRYLGARYINVGNVSGASFISEFTTDVSDPEKFYPSGITVI